MLGQGRWAMGEDPGRKRLEADALRLGMDLGMTLVDTAEMYGEGGAEEVVAAALAGRREHGIPLMAYSPLDSSAAEQARMLAAPGWYQAAPDAPKHPCDSRRAERHQQRATPLRYLPAREKSHAISACAKSPRSVPPGPAILPTVPACGRQMPPFLHQACGTVSAFLIIRQRLSSCWVLSSARRVPADRSWYCAAAASSRLTLAGVQFNGIISAKLRM